MPKWATRLAIWGPLLVAGALLVAYVLVHRPFATDPTELVQVPLSEEDPELTRVGALEYLGGLDIPRMGQNIGGLSGLRWDEASGRLLAITDDARWVWITPVEEQQRLIGLADVEVGDLLGLEGEILRGKQQGDSESLTRSNRGGWLVGFERDHRIWRYDDLSGVPAETDIRPDEIFAELGDNQGLEALADSELDLFLCAQRATMPEQSNCVRRFEGGDTYAGFPAEPPEGLSELGAVPTDADMADDGTLYVLFRSYSELDGNAIGIKAYLPFPSIEEREIVSLRPPFTVDNFEGLAVRTLGSRTFLYIVSDDNFSSNQRTLLMKFEVIAPDRGTASPNANTPPSSTP